MNEEELYNLVQRALELEGYYPVRKSPLIRIRGYRPDVTGLKGQEVVCVEVKPDFNERSTMEAMSQARVYQLGSTHTWVAFPRKSYDDAAEQLRTLIAKLCRDFNVGLYLVEIPSGILDSVWKPHLNENLDLNDYNSVIGQLEGEEWPVLRNSYPEYVRDICRFIYRGDFEDTRKEMLSKLQKQLSEEYWLHKSRSGAGKSDAAHNRVKDSVEAAIELGVLEVKEPDPEGNSDKDILSPSYTGKMLGSMSKKLESVNKPEALDEPTRAFLSGLMIKLPAIQMAVRELSDCKRPLPLAVSRCSSCNGKLHFKDIEKEDNDTVCSKCKKTLGKSDVSLEHRLMLRHGSAKPFWPPIQFTKSLYPNSSLIFEFRKQKKIDIISLKN